ncbi:MAG: TlpA disulfide reductase family protein [Mariprofundaceae bacterium]|nr:TlpA disulfide reductase family protein [Mariprofundaceae bacterium]
MLKNWLVMAGVFISIGVLAWVGLQQTTPLKLDTSLASLKPAVGESVSSFELLDLAGKMQALPEGEVVLLNFWATWCPPCREEMPSMQALYARFKAKGLKIIAVSVDAKVGNVQKFVQDHDLTFQILHDSEGEVARQYGVHRYPETFVIDREGKVRLFKVGGVDWMSDESVALFESLLASK